MMQIFTYTQVKINILPLWNELTLLIITLLTLNAGVAQQGIIGGVPFDIKDAAYQVSLANSNGHFVVE